MREKGIKMAVVSSLGKLENWGSVKENERLWGGYGSGKDPRERMQNVMCVDCKAHRVTATGGL